MMADFVVSGGSSVIADDATLELSAQNVMSVKDGGIDSDQIAASAVTAAKMGFESMHLLEEVVVAGGAVQAIEFTGLDLEADAAYFIELTWLASEGGGEILVYFNNDTTAGNYHRQQLTANGATISGNAFANSRLVEYRDGFQSVISGTVMKSVGGSPNITVFGNDPASGDPFISNANVKWDTTDNVTVMKFHLSGGNDFPNGSVCRLFKKA